jgi:O-antigen ligase
MQHGGPTGEETPREGRFFLALVFGALASLALAAAWLAPNHYPPWTSFHGEAAAFAALVLFAAARVAWPQPLVRTRVAFPVAAVLALIATQWLAGQIAYRGDAYLSALYVAGAGLAWWLGANSESLRTRTDPVIWFAWIVVLAAAVSVVIIHLQWLRMENALGIFAAERGPDFRPYSNIGQPNHLSTLMIMATALAVLLNARGRLGDAGCVALVAWFGWGLVLTESRSGLLSALCLAVLACSKGRRQPGVPAPRWALLWVALLFAMALSWPTINEALYLESPRGAMITHDSSRQVIWKQCLAGIQASPWVGYGWRQSAVGQKVGALVVDGWQASDYAHNLFLDLLLWVGVPLGVLVIIGAVAWLARVFLRLRGATEVLLFATILPLAVHSMFEFPFAYSYFLFPAAWMLAVLARKQSLRLGVANVRSRLRLPVAAGIALFAVAAGAAASDYMQAEEDYRVMRFELRRVGRTPDNYASPDLAVLTQLGELLKLGRMVPRPGMPAADIARLRQGTRSVNWANLHLAYVLSLALNGQPRLAESELRLLRSDYGEEAYAQAREIWQAQLHQYPQLAAVRLP